MKMKKKIVRHDWTYENVFFIVDFIVSAALQNASLYEIH